MNKTVSHCLAFSPLLLPVIGGITPRKKNCYLSILIKRKATSRGTLSGIFSCHVKLKEKKKIGKTVSLFPHPGRNGERFNLTNGRPLSLTFPVKDIKKTFHLDWTLNGREKLNPRFLRD